MTDDVLKVLVPVLTFVLGSAVTIAVRTAEQHRDVLRTAAREAAKLTKDWYVQIHTLSLSRAPGRFDAAISTGVYDYIHNRLILPDFMLHLEVLRTKRRAASLVEALDEFLNDVTQARPTPLARYDQSALECKRLLVGLDEPEEADVAGVALRSLDLHVQRVTREAAKLLA